MLVGFAASSRTLRHAPQILYKLVSSNESNLKTYVMNRLIISFALILISISCFAQVPKKAETLSINGKNVYYEVYGAGKPLFLLHGYSHSSTYWIPYVKYFQEDFEVYLVDLQGHGKSDIFDKDWSIKSVADNLNDFVQHLELEEIRAIGFSYGGDVLFQLSVINPSLIKSMVTIGALGSWDIKDYPDWEEFFQYSNLENLTWIKTYQTDDEHIKSILDLFKNYSVLLSEEQLNSIQTSVLLILGDDDDSMPLEEVNRVRNNLQKSDLWVLPNSPHGAHEGDVEEFVRIAKSFLSKE